MLVQKFVLGISKFILNSTDVLEELSANPANATAAAADEWEML